MGTRSWYETKLLNNFNEIRFARMYYDRENKEAAAYVADNNHQLGDDLKEKIESYLREHGSAHLNHKVKSYSELKVDGVTENPGIPHEYKIIALTGELNQKGIMNSLKLGFPFLNMQLAQLKGDILKIWVSSDVNLMDLETQLIRDYAQELVPISVQVELF